MNGTTVLKINPFDSVDGYEIIQTVITFSNQNDITQTPVGRYYFS